MNFLAHAFLSGSSKDLIIGNFIADSVRGKDYQGYRQGIIDGILLHRKIDTFTDQHPIVANTKKIIRPYFNKYASVVSDIYYDHFLALNWNDYSNEPLKEFTQNLYSIIRSEIDGMPEDVKYLLPYMEKNDWLYNYQFFYGMEQSFKGMSRRAKFDSGMENGVEVLKKNYELLQIDFDNFFPELQQYVSGLISK